MPEQLPQDHLQMAAGGAEPLGLSASADAPAEALGTKPRGAPLSEAGRAGGARWGNFAWAGLLVAGGAVLLAFNFDALSAHTLRAIVRWWPALLILAGLRLA